MRLLQVLSEEGRGFVVFFTEEGHFSEVHGQVHYIDYY
jgi:hypothetical protein